MIRDRDIQFSKSDRKWYHFHYFLHFSISIKTGLNIRILYRSITNLASYNSVLRIYFLFFEILLQIFLKFKCFIDFDQNCSKFTNSLQINHKSRFIQLSSSHLFSFFRNFVPNISEIQMFYEISPKSLEYQHKITWNSSNSFFFLLHSLSFSQILFWFLIFL